MKFWWNTIADLRADLEYTKNQKYRVEQTSAANLSLKEAYYRRVLEEKDTIARALADENRDLVRQLELLRALLGQLRVNITLPARKK